MSSIIRIIPKLDIKGPNIIKGLQFDGLRVLGTAEEFASKYYLEGADELIYQDAVASLYGRDSLYDIIKKTANKIFIPLTVSGGIRNIEDITSLLRAGADKVAINTSAVEDPELLKKAVKIFGSQCIVSSIEVYRTDRDTFEVWTNYGKDRTNMDAVEWAKRVQALGVGEILLTSIRNDGTGKGYDLELIKQVSTHIEIPIIACGGAGKLEHFSEAIHLGVDAIAAASCFHYAHIKEYANKATMQYDGKELRMGKNIDAGNIDFLNIGHGSMRALMVDPLSIKTLKTKLHEQNIPVRLL